MIACIWNAWLDSGAFILNKQHFRSFFKLAWKHGNRIMFFSMLVLVVVVFDAGVQHRLLFPAVERGSIFVTYWAHTYLSCAFILFVPFLLQRFAGSGAQAYGYFLLRWLIWYVFLIVGAALFSVPLFVLGSFLSHELRLFLYGVVVSMKGVAFWTFPFIVASHVYKVRRLFGVFEALTAGIYLLITELPLIVLSGICLIPFFLILYSSLLSAVSTLMPAISAIVDVGLRMIIAQVGWSLLLSAYWHRTGRIRNI